MNFHPLLMFAIIDSTVARLDIALNNVPKKPRLGCDRGERERPNRDGSEREFCELDSSESEVTGGIACSFPSI